MTRSYYWTGVALAAALSLLACGGGDESGSGSLKAQAFPDSVVDEELLVRVNGHPIMGKDLRVYAIMYGLGTRDSLSTPAFNQRLLDGLIDRTLLWLEAQTLGVAIDDSTRDWYLNQFIKATGGERVFNETLLSADIAQSDVQHLIRQDLQVRKFIETSVATAPAVTDSMALSYYRNNLRQFWSADSVRARHIIIRASEKDTPTDIENKKQTLRELRRRALENDDFAELAKEYSEGPSASAGGDLGYFSRQDMVQSFSDAAFSLEPGQVSDVVATSYGYHIIEVQAKKPRRKYEYEEIKEQLKYQLGQQMAGQVLQNHLQEMRSVAIIERNY